MEQYEKYKDSGIEWVGEIPEYWETNKFNRIAFYQEGPGLRNWQFTTSGIKVICVTNIVPPIIDFSSFQKYISEQEYDESYQHFTVNKGDLLLASSGASWGKVSEYDDNERVILNTSTIRLNENHSQKVSRNFIKWIIQSPYVFEQLNVLLTGSCQPNFGPSHLSQLRCAYPKDKFEQTSIATYLNRKTAEIDQIIANKQKLIALYEEEKQAIINQSVTKGLDPNVKMKDSGVDWLGEIPEHWEVKKLKHLVTKIGSGVTPTGGSNVYQTSGIPLLRSQNVYFDGLRLEDVAYISEEIDESMSNSRINEKDILLNITGGSIGRCYYVPEGFGPGNVNQHVCILRPILERIDYIFLYFLLRSNIGQLQIDFQQTGANREGLNFEQLKNFVIPMMDITEQKCIVVHIEKECSRLDAIIEKFNKQIDLFQEYRTTLISEVVTGKVKVSNIIDID